MDIKLLSGYPLDESDVCLVGASLISSSMSATTPELSIILSPKPKFVDVVIFKIILSVERESALLFSI